MKYDPKRHLLHPVLSPNNDDYPDGELTTKVEVSPEVEPGKDVRIEIQFQLNEPYLHQAVAEDGSAKCKAMIYCTSTVFRTDYEAAEGEFGIVVEIPESQLDGAVEVHPFIISATDISLDSDGIHPEYRQLEAPLEAEQETASCSCQPTGIQYHSESKVTKIQSSCSTGMRLENSHQEN